MPLILDVSIEHPIEDRVIFFSVFVLKIWLPPENTAKAEKGWKKNLNSNWTCKKKGYSKLCTKDVHKILTTNVLLLWLLFRGFFSE